jgi:hypothetical protein
MERFNRIIELEAPSRNRQRYSYSGKMHPVPESDFFPIDFDEENIAEARLEQVIAQN